MLQSTESGVDVQAVMEDLKALKVRFPVDAIRTIQRHRALFIPALIQSIERSCDLYEAGQTEEPGEASFFALYLLTEFSALEAWPTIRRVMHLKSDGAYTLYGDSVPEVFQRILPVFAQGKTDILDKILDNPELNQSVRWSAASAYMYLVRDQQLTREEAVEGLRRHLRNAIDRNDSDLCNVIGCELLDYCPIEAEAEIAEAFRLELIDETIFDEESVLKVMNEGLPEFQKRLLRLEPTGIPDTVEELEWWHSYREPDDDDFSQSHRNDEEDDTDSLAPETLIHQLERQMGTIRNTTTKVGRNEPCPCRSGKKYKKCCGMS